MRVGIVSVFVDYHRLGQHYRGVLQPQAGSLLAGLMPRGVEVDVVNDAWGDPDWSRDYDLLFVSALHSDFDRARQISHYWRRRGARTVYGGTFASNYPHLVAPYFDAIVVGDPEDTVPRVVADFRRGALKARYASRGYRAEAVRPPRFDLMVGQSRLPVGLEGTRGCPFDCEFCVMTALGTRYEQRPVDAVVRDVEAGLAGVEARLPWHKRRGFQFYDNNLGGSPQFLRALCARLERLDVRWGAAVTFNIIANRSLVAALSRAGCRALFVGLESFNERSIADMGKHHNIIAKARGALDQCRDHGILIFSGLMLNPRVDDESYVRALPELLDRSGLNVPTFLCFEAPIPGTPYFHRLAADGEPAFLPNALLRDFNGYTLVTRPARISAEAFVRAYREALPRIYSAGRRFAKLAHDLPAFLLRGYLWPTLLDLGFHRVAPMPIAPTRTYLAGSDTPPPERVPLAETDFDSEAEYRDLMQPLAVTDADGRVLPAWRRSQLVFQRHDQRPHRGERARLAVASAAA